MEGYEIAALMGNLHSDNPDILANGIRSKIGYTSTKAEYIRKEKGEDWLFDFILWEIIKNILHDLQQLIEYHQKEMDRLLVRIAQNHDRFDELEHDRLLLDEQIKVFEKQGFFELDEQGRLKNKEAEAVLSTWEERTGQQIDRSDPSAYGAILNIVMEIENEQAVIRQEIERQELEYEYHKEKRDEAIQISEELKSEDLQIQVTALSKAEILLNNFAQEQTPQSRYISPVSQNNISKTPNLANLGLDEPLDEGDNFSFSFPSLQNDFGNAAAAKANNQNPVSEVDVTKQDLTPQIKNRM